MTEKNKPFLIFTLALIAVVILNSGHALFSIVLEVQYIVMHSCVIVLITLLGTVKNKKVKQVLIGVVFMFIAILMCSMIIRWLLDISALFLITCIAVTAFGIAVLYDANKIVDLFLKFMVIVTVISIIGYVITNYTNLDDYFLKLDNVNGIEYKTVFVYSTISIIPDRNCGIFWEPGIFASFLVYAIVMELLFKKGEYSIPRLLLFVGALLTTNSAAGYVLLLLCVLLFVSVLLQKNNNKKVKIVLISGMAGVTLLLILLNFIILATPLKNNEHFQKLLFSNLIGSSRVNAVIHNLKIWAEYPIFGAGFKVVLERAKSYPDTSTSTYIMSLFGVIGIVYNALWVYGVFRTKDKSLLTRIILFVILFCILNKEPHLSNLFTWIVMFFLCFRNTEEESPLLANWRKLRE